MRKFAISVLMFAMSCSAAVSAAEKMKPGLWEMTLKSDAMKNMPKIPPEQLKQMREMGVAIPQMQDGGIVSKVCVTKEMAEQDDVSAYQAQVGCKAKNVQRSGNTYSMDYVCDGPDMKGTGKVKGSYSGNERFTSATEFSGTMHGRPVNTRQETSGKWLAADCGSVKPMNRK